MENYSAANNKPQELPQINTVLVVDDDDNWCFVTKMLLQDCGVGKQVITAYNGLEALKRLQTLAATGEKLPELIFLDAKMPVMDGFEFLEQFTNSPELNLNHTKIYMCTSSFLAKDKDKANLYPISGFITKPLTKENILDILSKYQP